MDENLAESVDQAVRALANSERLFVGPNHRLVQVCSTPMGDEVRPVNASGLRVHLSTVADFVGPSGRRVAPPASLARCVLALGSWPAITPLRGASLGEAERAVLDAARTWWAWSPDERTQRVGRVTPAPFRVLDAVPGYVLVSNAGLRAAWGCFFGEAIPPTHRRMADALHRLARDKNEQFRDGPTERFHAYAVPISLLGIPHRSEGAEAEVTSARRDLLHARAELSEVRALLGDTEATPDTLGASLGLAARCSECRRPVAKAGDTMCHRCLADEERERA